MSIEPLLNGLFDYAGMFPPAALPFDEAMRESARFEGSLRRPWLVANGMVLTPAALEHLDEDAMRAAGFADGELRVCLVGVPLEDAEAQAMAVAAFNEERRHGASRQRIASLEIHAESLDGAPETLRAVRKIVGSVELYFEPKWDDKMMAERHEEVVGMLHGLRADGAAIGFKARCAGPTEMSPSTLATVLSCVNRHGVPLKLTQGLHHPIAGDANHGNRHGFLNVAMALRLQRALRLSTSDVEAILRETEPAAFDWDAGIAWNGQRAMMQSVAEAIQAVPFAIGSCSLREPDDELAALLD